MSHISHYTRSHDEDLAIWHEHFTVSPEDYTAATLDCTSLEERSLRLVHGQDLTVETYRALARVLGTVQVAGRAFAEGPRDWIRRTLERRISEARGVRDRFVKLGGADLQVVLKRIRQADRDLAVVYLGWLAEALLGNLDNRKMLESLLKQMESELLDNRHSRGADLLEAALEAKERDALSLTARDLRAWLS